MPPRGSLNASMIGESIGTNIKRLFGLSWLMAFVINISEVSCRATERGKAAVSRFATPAICKMAI